MAVLTKKQAMVLKSYFQDSWKYLILAGAKRAGKTFINNFIFVYEIKRVAKLAKEKGSFTHRRYLLIMHTK